MRMHALLARRRRTDEASRPDPANRPSCGDRFASRTPPTVVLLLGSQSALKHVGTIP